MTNWPALPDFQAGIDQGQSVVEYFQIVTAGAIRSAGYQPGVSGWSINANGSAEFQDVTVRGTLNADDITAGTLNIDRIADGSITGAKIGGGQISLDLFASGIEPVQVVSSLPPTADEGDIAYLTTTNKLYRYDGAQWIATVDGSDVVGAVTTAGGIPTGGALPGTGSAGDLFFLTTDEKLYRHNGTAWILAVDGADVGTGTLPADKIVANSITTGQIQAGGIAADRLVANSITTTQIQAAGIDADRLVANSITAGEIQAGAIGASELAAINLEVGKYIQSTSYTPGVSGWSINADGTAEFNNLIVRGDVISGNWDGADPPTLNLGRDATATAGFALDSSAGAAQFKTIYADGGELRDLLVYGELNFQAGSAKFLGSWQFPAQGVTPVAGSFSLSYSGGTGHILTLAAPYDSGSSGVLGRLQMQEGVVEVQSSQFNVYTDTFLRARFDATSNIYTQLSVSGDLYATSNLYVTGTLTAGTFSPSSIAASSTGSAASPTYGWSGYSGTGIYKSNTTAHAIGMSLAGTKIVDIYGVTVTVTGTMYATTSVGSGGTTYGNQLYSTSVGSAGSVGVGVGGLTAGLFASGGEIYISANSTQSARFGASTNSIYRTTYLASGNNASLMPDATNAGCNVGTSSVIYSAMGTNIIYRNSEGTPSSVELKNLIDEGVPGMELVRVVPMRRWRYKDPKAGTHDHEYQWGPTAEDVRDALTRVGDDPAKAAIVHQPLEEGTLLHLQESQLVPVLWRALQELDDRLARLEAV